MYVFMKLFLIVIFKFLFINNKLFISNVCFAMAILLFISFVDLLFVVIKLPE